MTETDFYNWFSGYLELSKCDKIDEEQLTIIKDHIALVQAEKLNPLLSVGPRGVEVTYHDYIVNPPPTHGNPFPTAPVPGPYGWEVTCSQGTPISFSPNASRCPQRPEDIENYGSFITC